MEHGSHAKKRSLRTPGSGVGGGRRILRTPAAAEYLGLGIPTLEKKRLVGDGPKFIRLGSRAVGYDLLDLDAWIDLQKRTSTSDGAA
jgi:predicted DNA-binding transcriptional regulator AlpA